MTPGDDTSDPDVVVIGAGIVGSSMAVMMARQGRRVTVIEKDMGEPDRIVGELLQPGGCRALRKLGLGECIENLGGRTIRGYVIHDVTTNSRVEVPYHLVAGEDPGVAEGKAFHHGRFIMALRKAANAEINTRFVEGTVSKLIEQDNVVKGVVYRDKGSGENKEIYAPLTIVADGCFSKFRKCLVKEKPVIKSHFVGLLVENCPQWKQDHAELILAHPSPVLIYQISTTFTRVLVDIRGDVPRDLKGYLADEIYPQLPEHIQEPFMDSIQNGRIRTMPNNFLPPSPLQKAGVLCLGDAYNMRHPLTGAGMSVALSDVVICQDLFKDIPDLSDQERVCEATRRLYARRGNNHSFAVDVLAMALYELFAATDCDLMCLKTACFEYFKLGGDCVRGPVGLLSVLNPRPSILIYHFFAVCLFAMWHTFRSRSLWKLHRSLYKSSGIFYKACGIIFPLMWSELKPGG